jgi:hypothetical protein
MSLCVPRFHIYFLSWVHGPGYAETTLTAGSRPPQSGPSHYHRTVAVDVQDVMSTWWHQSLRRCSHRCMVETAVCARLENSWCLRSLCKIEANTFCSSTTRRMQTAVSAVPSWTHRFGGTSMWHIHVWLRRVGVHINMCTHSYKCHVFT